jgi:hypothetical protein
MPVITLGPGVYEAILADLSEMGLPPCLRIHLRSSGCCDASLGLVPDLARPPDLSETVGDLTLIVGKELFALVGEIGIEIAERGGENGFIVTSRYPLNEWSGFAACSIRER